MPNTKKYVSLAKLTKYDELLKAKMAADDAQVLADAKAFAESLGSNYEGAGTVASAKTELQGKIDALANGAVKANTDAIAKLNGGVTEEGSVAKAVADSAAILQASIEATDAIADQNALDIDTLEGKVAALEAGTYDDTEVRNLISANGDAIEALEQAHATDKGTLEGAIALKADQTALDDVSAVANAAVKQSDYDTKVAALEAEDARIAGLVAAETERASNAESGLDERLVEVEAFFKLAEGEQLDTAMDTLVEIQKYITDDGAAADEMVKDIAANAKAIADHIATDHDFATADAALKEELEGKIGAKADASVVTELSGKVTAAEGKISANEQAIAALQTAIGDNGSVDTMIDEAVSAAIEAEEARVDGLLDKKVDKVEGKGLSTNDLTNELKGQYDAAYAHSQAAHAPVDAQANVIEAVKVNGVALTVTGKAVDIAVPTDNTELTNGAGYLVASDIANKADKATTLAGYGITDAYTTAQTDTAIANAMAQFVEVSEAEINQLFGITE